jgi:ACS family glucarate transporter-like MFS transporter
MHVNCWSLLRGRVRWTLVGWMFAISSIAYLDRVNISIAGHSIQGEFGLDNVQLGWVFSAFLVGYSLFQTPGGWLADRFGPRKIVALGTVWWGVFTTLTALVPSGFGGALAVLLTVRFALGIGEAMLYPASNQMVASWIPSQERGIANGVIFAGVGAGAGITPPLITFILLTYGWRWSFYICALLGIAAGVGWFLTARDRPEDHPWVGPEELGHIRAGLPQRRPSHGSRPSVPWGRIFASREVLALTFSYACFGYVAYIFYTWFFIYLSTVRGLDLKSSSYYSMLPFIAMATCSPLGGWIGDRLTKRFGKRTGRCGLAGLGSGAAALFLALGTQASDARLATIVLAGGAGALFLSTSSFWSVTADVGGASAGTVSGVMNTGNQIAGAVTASLTPVIAAHLGWTASFLVAAALCAAGALTWLLVDPERRLVGT